MLEILSGQQLGLYGQLFLKNWNELLIFEPVLIISRESRSNPDSILTHPENSDSNPDSQQTKSRYKSHPVNLGFIQRHAKDVPKSLF